MSKSTKKVYIVYECDAWLSWGSMDIKGIYLTKEDAVDAIVKNNCYHYSDFFEEDDESELTKKEKRECVEDEVRKEIQRHGQTQCHETNYHIRQYDLGEWD